ncbi:glycosyl transferase [Enterococcus florum]|uniref:Glycosyl transferase n=1 Tax=Enterococcus florum TaxID=2480627 RepID=A0A4P5P8R4_9ENTE|nr:rhamnan synthesis F family protein [Enterococcus florum]GCF93926.1 glycosyl transferase [Enterococcus florum]
MMDLITVIVTCYNHELYIEECLYSIFKQTYSEIQLIVINDGSTDLSNERIKRTIQESPFKNTTYISQDNQGVCVSRNLGIENAQGKYLLFVDADNFLDDSHIEKLHKVAEEEHADIIYTDLYDPDKQEFFLHSRDYDFQSLIEHNYIDNCALLRTSVINDVRYDITLNRKFLEDYDFILTLIIDQQAKPYYARGLKLNYRVLSNSVSRKDNHTSREYFYEVYLYILKKHVLKIKDAVFHAVDSHLMSLENRLSDLTNHLNEVTSYVKDTEKQFCELLAEKDEFKAQNHQQSEIIRDLIQDKELLVNSTSYRLGNSIVKPFKYLLKILKNPRLVKKAIKRIYQYGSRQIKKMPNPKTYGLRILRNMQRKNNQNPKRLLIYVIYENQNHLQEYKLLFLESLAMISDEILIIVNGELSVHDTSTLEKYGKVIFRENEGYDTAAFRHGILTIGKENLKQYDELLLVNDTNVGPMSDLKKIFEKMSKKQVDFWGISYGEEQPDITTYNPYQYIPIHLQTYFLVVRKNLLSYSGFYDYWLNLTDTNSRMKAVGRHETVFTKYFSDLGFAHDAVVENNQDSAMYIHPLKMLQAGVPLVKYSAFSNYDDDRFLWQGLQRNSEIPALVEYIKANSLYPMSIIEKILEEMKAKSLRQDILIIDGVENQIPQCTRYRALNKAEQLRSFGYNVRVINSSAFRLSDAEFAHLVIIYRCGYSDQLAELCRLAKQFKKTVLYDIDDLVIDTKYTDLLEYTQKLSKSEKANYDANVMGYGRMLKLCDGVITSTTKLKEELGNYQDLVLLNRNIVSQELISISRKHMKDYTQKSEKIKIGYFSGSITHNENFELVKPDLIKLMAEYPQIELHLVGHLLLPKDLMTFKSQIVTHDYVEWHELPALISEVDINIAPLTKSIFNEAKSEIKWLEATLVKVPTIASNIGAFSEMILEQQTGVLAKDGEWLEKLKKLIDSKSKRQYIAENAYQFVLKNCTTDQKNDELVGYINGKN